MKKMKVPKILISILLLVFTGIKVNAQLPDPSVNGATVTPAPNQSPGHSATVSFNFVNISSTAIPVNPGNHINVSLSNLDVNGVFNPATQISGAGAAYFTFTYNAAIKTLVATQSAAVPGLSGGQIVFQNLLVTGFSQPINPQNGLNVNVVFLGAFNASTTNDNTSAFTYAPQGALPVSLVNFNYKVKNCGVNLTWSTSQEVNSKDFVIENSADGINWTGIGTVIAKGNSASVAEYSFVHLNPVAGTNYYRLVISDKDGRTKYSDVLSVNVECGKAVINVNPNPFVDKIDIHFTSPNAEVVTVKLLDNTGKEVQSKQVPVQQGSNIITLNNLAKLSRGTYMLRVNTASATLAQKMMK